MSAVRLAIIAGTLVAGTMAASAQTAAPLQSLNDPNAVAEIERFCGAIIDPAREQRHAIQMQELATLKAEIESRIETLEGKRAELQKWIEMREKFSSQVTGEIVEVYAKMRPDAAAERLENVSPMLAAALIQKLKPRAAATILNEMSADQAAMLTGIMAGAAEFGEGG